MALIVDKYECYGCGQGMPPCRVTIPHTDDKLPQHLKGQDKFRIRPCVCDNQPKIMVDWQKVDEFTPFEID